MDAAPCNSELLLSKRSPSCTALQTPLSPQQQQQELGSLLARLQQGSVAGDEEQQLEDMCPSSPDQLGSCKRAAAQLPSRQSAISVWQPSHPALAPFQVAIDRHPVHPSTFLREASPGGTSSTCITNNPRDQTPPAAPHDLPSAVLLSPIGSQPHLLPAAAPKAPHEPASPAAAAGTVPLWAMQPSSPARPAAVPEVATPTARMPATKPGKESRSLRVEPAIIKQQKKRNKKRHKKVKQQPASHSTPHPPSPSNGKPSNSNNGQSSGKSKKEKGLLKPAEDTQQLHMGYLLLVGYGQAHSQMGWHRAMQLE
ncbi:hypothetical protein OEZ86_004383 [Tetradesmus obliquus]|nr:hypothetical protein OEZ86_004383 [Tetradesmus obliquus]